MTYNEILNALAARTAETYSSYLQSKISSLSDDDGFLADKTEQYRAEYDRLEKKLVALLATVKNEGFLNEEAPDDFYEEFIK
ncbi:MAG TPA: hypothetical protein VGC08_01260 [Pedobacter sp.]|jgi:inorganic pyrophosphatase